MTVPRTAARAQVVPFLFSGLIIMAAALWVFVLILHSVYGRFAISDILPTSANLQSVFAGSRVGILESGYSDRLLPDGSMWLHDNVSAWKRFLRSTDAEFDVLDDRSLESGSLKDYSLLVLPGSRALSEKEIAQIKSFIDRGGSVFATGGTATFNEDGEWKGWDFLSQVFGLQFTREITPDQATRAHTLRGGLPITAGIPSGYSLRVATWDNPIACKVVEPRTTQASTWYNFKSDSGLTRESIESTAGIAYGRYGRGKFVWMGFELNSVLGGQKDYVYFDLLCRRCVDWLADKPTVIVHDWPSGSSAAAMIVVPVASDTADPRGLVSSFKRSGIPVSTFSSSFGSHHAPLTNGLLYEPAEPAHDLGGLFSFPGHCGPTDIREDLDAGYGFAVLDSVSDRAVPEAVTKDGRKMVIIAKTARGDDEVIGQYGLNDTALQLYTYREDIDRVLFQGGVYTLQLHSELQGRPEFIGVVDQLAAYLKEKNVWVGTASEIARWWLSRSDLNVSIQQRSKRRVALVVTNTSKDEIQDVAIQVNLNQPAANVGLTSDILGTTIPAFRFNPKTDAVEITIPSIPGGSSLSLFVDYDQPAI